MDIQKVVLSILRTQMKPDSASLQRVEAWIREIIAIGLERDPSMPVIKLYLRPRISIEARLRICGADCCSDLIGTLPWVNLTALEAYFKERWKIGWPIHGLYEDIVDATQVKVWVDDWRKKRGYFSLRIDVYVPTVKQELPYVREPCYCCEGCC